MNYENRIAKSVNPLLQILNNQMIEFLNFLEIDKICKKLQLLCINEDNCSIIITSSPEKIKMTRVTITDRTALNEAETLRQAQGDKKLRLFTDYLIINDGSSRALWGCHAMLAVTESYSPFSHINTQDIFCTFVTL